MWRMRDQLGREINYLRVSVTDRCNLRCRYCMPEEGVELTEHRELLSLEELGRLVDVSTEIGITRVRITGGEPLLRRNLTSLIAHMAANPRITDLAMTTNGIRLPALAGELRQEGLHRVNISLDTLDPEKYHYITRGGELSQARAAIEAALACGLTPVKLNVVVIRGFNDDEIEDFADLACRRPLHIRFIEFMPVGDLTYWDRSRWIKSEEIKERISLKYPLLPDGDLVGAGPATCYRIAGGRGTVGFITPLSSHFCYRCNRLRLTAQGKLLGCLHSHQGIDLKEPLRAGASDQELKRLFLEAVQLKPGGHHLNQGWGEESTMSQIGG